MRRYFFLTILLFTGYSSLQAQSQYAFRVKFSDKEATGFSLESPATFLSEKAIARRGKYTIPIDSTDLPVPATYINELLTVTGGVLHNSSRWFNQCTILLDDSAAILAATTLPYVSSVRKVAYYAGGLHERPGGSDTSVGLRPTAFDETYYGSAWSQIHVCEGQYLHEQGYAGANITIAVLDVGFPGVESASGFDSLRSEGRLLDAYNFIYNDANVYDGDTHGTRVLSCMAGYLPDTYVGTAPKANYLLYATDHASTEQLIEEDNWIAAAERADSAGADIISTSLGYNTFDDEEDSYAYSALDGNTTLFARAANTATRKGVLVAASAGNEGMTSWGYILTPGDADSALTVGSVNNLKEPALTSGEGPNAAGRLKPNVCVQGVGNSLITASGSITTGSGASFATPVLAGLAACLMQAAPEKTPLEIRSIIEQVSDHYTEPDNKIGYGVPDFSNALRALSVQTPAPGSLTVLLFPNPAEDVLHIEIPNLSSMLTINVTDIYGRMVAAPVSLKPSTNKSLLDISSYTPGIYFLHIATASQKNSFKFIKR